MSCGHVLTYCWKCYMNFKILFSKIKALKPVDESVIIALYTLSNKAHFVLFLLVILVTVALYPLVGGSILLWSLSLVLLTGYRLYFTYIFFTIFLLYFTHFFYLFYIFKYTFLLVSKCKFYHIYSNDFIIINCMYWESTHTFHL